MKFLYPLLASFLMFSTLVDGQVFYLESFENNDNWSLSHTYDNGGNKYVKRDVIDNFTGLEFIVFGQDGNSFIGVENSDAGSLGAPDNGIITLDFGDIIILGKENIQCVVSIACNTNDLSYDDKSLPNGDFLEFQMSVDNSTWQTIGNICATGGSENNSGLFHDVNLNIQGGEIGEPEITSTFTDYVFPITTTGTTLQLKAVFRMTESGEEIIFDNVRLRENTVDDSAPTIHSIQLLDNQSVKVFFNEPMTDNATNTAFYSGISGLQNVELANGNMEAILTYSNPFVIGEGNTLTVFGLSDVAGNLMTSPFQDSFYYNPTQPELIITEIMYNDPSAADSVEFFEVYNHDNSDIQIGGFTVSGTIDFTFPTTTLSPGEYFLIGRKPNPSGNFYSETFENYNGSLSNNGGLIRIKNTNGLTVDVVNYDNNIPWPPAGNGLGSSIALVNYNENNNDGNNWVSSYNGIGFINGIAVSASPGFGLTDVSPVIQFAQEEYSTNETDGSIDIQINISGSNSNPSTINLTITGNGTGDNEDISLTQENIAFAANANNLTTTTINILNDLNIEGFEYVTIDLESPINATVGWISTTTILINDDEFTAPSLFINELMSKNLNDTTDNYNEHNDWLEIYNPNDFAVDIAGYYLSDDATNDIKFRIPHGNIETVIPAESWVLFWADEDGEQGDFHTNFKLSSGGEYLGLTAPDGVTDVDHISFPSMNSDESYGRISDGNIEWITFNNPTPDQSNSVVGIYEFATNSILPFPNPTNGLLRWGEAHNIELYDTYGRLILKSNQTNVIDLSSFANGIYLLRFTELPTSPIKILKQN